MLGAVFVSFRHHHDPESDAVGPYVTDRASGFREPVGRRPDQRPEPGPELAQNPLPAPQLGQKDRLLTPSEQMLAGCLLEHSKIF